MAGRDKRIGAVAISKNLPVLGTGAIAIPELDIGASSSAGVVDIKVAAGDEVPESVVAGGLTLEVPLVGGSVGSGGQVDIGGVFDAVGAETDVIRKGRGELINAVGEVGGDGVGGQWVRLGWDLGATEPVGEVEEEVAVAVGRAGIARAVAGGKGGGVGLVGGVAIERSSGTVLNIDSGAAAASVGAEADLAGGAGGIEVVVVVENIAEKSGSVTDLVLEAVVLAVAGGGVRAAVAGGGAVLATVGVGVGDKTLLFLEEDDEDLGVDAIILGGLIDDLGSGLAGADYGAVTETFLGEADEMAVGAAFPVPSNSWVERGLLLIEGIVAIVARVFLGEEGLDLLDGHRIVVAHDGVAHDVAGAKTGSRSGAEAVHHEKSEGGDHAEEKDGAEESTG